MKIRSKILLLGLISLLAACTSSPYRTTGNWCKRCVETENISLSADALFKFDKYAEKDLLEKGRKTLDILARRLKTSYATIEELNLVGHTDRLGSNEYNYTLGLNRAKTIRNYLQSRGVNAPVKVNSAGEKQPVTNGCQGITPKSALTACLQPDRRVTVQIKGQRKGRNCGCSTVTTNVEDINLAADALFKFDKYAEKDLLEKGRLTLDELANKINTGYATVQDIALIGHTDRLGSEKYNYTLGLNRAKTIRAYLQQKGVQATINVESAGETQPVTDGCLNVSPKSKLTACLQPDRRVTVRIAGQKKTTTKSCKQK